MPPRYNSVQNPNRVVQRMHIIIFITAKNFSEAQKISEGLLKKKLIACANIIRGVESFFWWQGKIDKAKEALLIVKTQRRLFSKIVKTVKSLHSYDCPEIIALPILKGSKDYLKWIDDSVSKK